MEGCGFRVWGLGCGCRFRVSGLGFRIQGLGIGVKGRPAPAPRLSPKTCWIVALWILHWKLRLGVWGLGLGVESSGFRVVSTRLTMKVALGLEFGG